MLLAALALLAGPLQASAGAGRTGVDYVALGDSVAAGRGLDDTGGLCRRSPRAYPRLVLSELTERTRGRIRFSSLACSGATAGQSDAPGLRSFHRQVSGALARLTGRPALVSVTIGINDFEWSDIPRTYLRLRDPAPLFDAWLAAESRALVQPLRRELSRLLSRSRVRVVLSDYFNPVNRRSILFGGPLPCPDAALCFARTEAVVAAVNSTIREVVRGLRHRSRVRIASVLEAFRGHESPSPRCGSAAPAVAATWIQHPDDPSSNSFPLVDWPELASLLGSDWRGDCFHPNDAGATFIAGAVGDAARRLGR